MGFARSLTKIWAPLIAGPVAIGLVLRLTEVRRGSQWVGLGLAVMGVVGVVWSRWTLGSAFAVAPEARQLVTDGIYCKLRNPIYVFGNIFIAGLILLYGDRRLWLLLAVIVVVQVVRARREARVLEEKFGEAYRSYRQRTWF